MSIENTTVRFFIVELETIDIVEVEVSERDFLDADGSISYERHTVRENGVSQICLTKNPFV